VLPTKRWSWPSIISGTRINVSGITLQAISDNKHRIQLCLKLCRTDEFAKGQPGSAAVGGAAQDAEQRRESPRLKAHPVPKEALGVWSPHRDSKSVLAFKSMLGMRAERWLWLNEPDQASWWVVDGTRDNLSELTVNLHREKAQGPVRGVLLAPDWSAVKDPVWVFFKVPLQVNQVYRWIDACCPQPSAPVSAEALFAEQHIQLLRWPNMTRYNANATVAQGIELTVACARLLSAPMTYEEVRSLLPTEANRTQLDVVLKDALQNSFQLSGNAEPHPSGFPFVPQGSVYSTGSRTFQ
jgi:hypothetical protein